MGAPDSNYQIVYRGEALPRFVPGGWVFFQRQKEHGGGYLARIRLPLSIGQSEDQP